MDTDESRVAGSGASGGGREKPIITIRMFATMFCTSIKYDANGLTI